MEKYFDQAAKLSTVPSGTLNHIRAVDSVLRVTFPIEVDDGKFEVIEGMSFVLRVFSRLTRLRPH